MTGTAPPHILTSKSFAEFISTGKSQLEEDLTSASILVVDDSRTGRMLIMRHLRTGGFLAIEEAGDGSEAMEEIRTCAPELVITDLLMPNVDGLEFCRQLRASPGMGDIPVLVLTGSTDPGLRAQAFESGATDLLAKPYDPRELLSRVRILLERGRLIQHLSRFQRRIADELLQAASVQESLLPDDEMLGNLTAHCPVEVAGHYEASVGLGGDLWGVDLVGDQRMLIFNADFTGHGLGAALNTVRLHSFIYGTQDKVPVPAILLKELNSFLCNVLPTGQFATMFCAVVDFRRRIIDYACAGSPPQLLRCGANRPFELIQDPAFPLGVTPSATYRNKTAPFAPGGTLLLFSDALIETPTPPNSVFTPETLCSFVNDLPPQTFSRAVYDSVLNTFFERIKVKPEDDLTLISAHFRAPESGS